MRKKGLESAGDYRKSLRQFLRLKDKKKYFDLIDSDYMRTTSKKGKILVDPETFWEQEHIEAYLRESKKYSIRQSAWAGLWSSTGCRPGEIMSMKKKDLEFKDGYLKVIVPEGKTGKRLVVLNGNNAPAVWQYIKPYWETLNEDDKLFDYHWTFANRVHKKICKRAGIPKDKDWSFYMARKLNLTKFYNTLGLAKASAMAGHTVGSKSMKHYVGLSESQMIQERPVEVSVKYCPNPSCGKAHETHETQCKKCGAPLDRKKYADILNNISNDKIEAIAELVKQKMLVKALS
jgi:integrase